MKDFKSKVDAFRIVKEEKNERKLSVYFEYYETFNNLLDGVMSISLAKTGGIGRLFGNTNLSLQQIMDMKPEITVTYHGKNRPKNEDTSSLLYDLYLRKRHPLIYKISVHNDVKYIEKKKFGLENDFYDDEDDDDDELAVKSD